MRRSGATAWRVQRADDLLREVGAHDAAGGHVDGDGEVEAELVEPLDLHQRLVQDPPGQRVDQVGLLGQRQEAVGIEQAVHGMLPAHECLQGADPIARRARLRLVVQHQLPVGDGVAQLGHQAEAGGVVLVEVGPVLEHAGALGLGGIHGHLGVLEEGVDVGIGLRRDDEADAGRHREGQAAHVHLGGDDLSQPQQRLLGVADVAQDEAELVAAQPRDGVPGAHVGADAPGQLGEQRDPRSDARGCR